MPSQDILKIRDEILKIRDEILKIRDVQKKIVARILVFKIRPSQDILKIRDGTHLEAEGILIYRKSPRNCSVWHFSSKLDVPSNVVQKKRVARILVFKIRPSQEILKIRDGTPLEAEGILTYRKRPSKLIGLALIYKPSQEILKIRDGTPLELDVPNNIVQKKRVSRILVFKIRPSQDILKIRDGTPLEAEGILIYRKSPRNCSVWHFSSKLDVPSNVVQKKRVARILVFKIRPSQEILKIRDGTPLEAEGILTYRKRPSKLIDILKIRDGTPLEWPSQEILKIRDGTPLEKILKIRDEILKIRDGTPLEWPSQDILKIRDVPSQEILKIRDVQKKRVSRILVFKIRPSQDILKIRDGTPLEAEGILIYRKSPRNCSVWHFSSKLDVPSNVVQKKRVARILVFKIRPSQEILKIRDGTPLEAEGILTYRKRPSKLIEILKIRDEILKIRDEPSQEILKIRDEILKIRDEILKIRDGTPLEKILKIRDEILKIRDDILKIRDVPSQEILKIRDVSRILVFKIRPSQDILKIRDGTPLEAEGILIYRKSPRNCSVWHFSSKLDVPSNVVQKKRVARILVFKIRPSQEILKIRDGTPFEAEGILTYRKRPSKLIEILKIRDVKIVARILVFKIRPSQDILKIRDGTPLEWPSQEILKIRDEILKIRDGTPLEWPSQEILKIRDEILKIRDVTPLEKIVARILVFKIRPSQDILKIRDGTPLEKPSQEILKIRDEILKIHDGTPLEWPSQDILKIRDGTPLEAEGILTYREKPPKLINLAFSSKLDIPNNIVQKKRVSRILVFKIRPSQEILKIRDGSTPLEAEGILTYRKRPSQEILKIRDVPSQEILKIHDGTPLEKIVARILVFKIRPSQDILKIRDGTPLEAEGILTYRKSPRNCSVWHFSSKLDVPSNVVQKKRMSRILVFKIRPSQEILKIHDGSTPLEINVVQKKIVARILVFKIRPSQDILKIRDGTPLEAEGILTYRKSPRNCSVWHFSSKLDVPSNVVQKKRVSRILVFKIRPSQEILKIHDGSTPLEIPSQEILKIRDGTPLDEGILTFRKRPSQEILKIHDGTPLEKKIVARILVFKIRPSQDILKIRDGTPLEAEGILTYRKSPRNCSVWHFSSKLDVPSNVVQKKRVSRILVFKIRPSQEILKIRDGTPLEAEGILTYRKRPSQEILKIRDGSIPLEWPSQEILKIHDAVPSNVVQKKIVARILVFKIRPSQDILKIRDGTPLEAEGILTYRKSPRNCSVWHFSSKLDVPSNVVQKKRVSRILVFKIRPSQEILKIRDGTPLEAEGILTYRKRPSKLIGLALF
ncbi:hypothetical protein OROHE_011706 [Orobanche hederae]